MKECNPLVIVRIEGENIGPGQTELLPQGSALPMDFWRSPSLDDLAEAQGVRPLSDVSVLFGSWPGETNDGFEETVLSLRRQSVAGEADP